MSSGVQYKTPTWERVYRTNRSTNEGFNGYAEDPTREAIQVSGARRIRGYAAQYVALAMKVAAANFRIITEFISRTPSRAPPSNANASSAESAARPPATTATR